jgi:hypothetical protein
MVEKGEPFGPVTAGILSGLFVLFIDSLLPLRDWLGELPIIPRVLLALSIGLFAWKAARYYELLCGAGAPPGSAKRADYDQLRGKLQAGGTPAKVYRDWLTIALDRVDAFFGDIGRNDKSWVARVLGLERPGARWTAPAFDRCLLLALLYLLTTIILVWMWSGHVGLTEQALGLWAASDDDALGKIRRCLFGLTALWLPISSASIIMIRTGAPDNNIKARFAASYLPTWIIFIGIGYYFNAIVSIIAISSISFFYGLALCFPVPGAGLLAAIFAAAISISPDRFYEVVYAAGRSIGAFGFNLDIVVDIIIFGSALFGSGVAALLITQCAAKRAARWLFIFTFFVLMVVLLFVAACFLSSSSAWRKSGVLLLVFGILTLVNAPFDWFAIGLTRGLLRRGLASGGSGPFVYAIIDAIVAPPVIVLLAFVTVLAVQTFDDIDRLRSAENPRILPLDKFFSGVDVHPGDPQYWWVWLMLFSTLIPSALNLCIAAASFMRGLPFLNTWILDRMSARGAAMRDRHRLLLASALSAQIAGGVLATGLALYFLGVWLLPMFLPALGAIVRHFSEALAAYDAPGQIIKWFFRTQ